MIDPSMTDAEFAEKYLAGKSTTTARRRIVEDGIPYHRDHGHWLIRQSDAEEWRAARMQRPAEPTLKSLIHEIAVRTLAGRKRSSTSDNTGNAAE